MFGLFRSKLTECKASPESCPVTFDHLDDSFHQLKQATISVSEEAVKTARVLEDKLKDSEFRFYSTVDIITDIVIIKDGQGRWTLLNKFGQDVFGWHHGEYYLKTDEELQHLYPQYKETLVYCRMSDDMAWLTKKPYRVEESIPHGTTPYHLDVVKTPVFHQDGSRKELIIIGRDITENYETRQRTKACFNALNSASDIIFIVDARRNIFFCNDMFVKTFDHNDYKEVVGKCVCDVIPFMRCNDEMWNVVKKNKLYEEQFEQYNLSIVPMMNGVPDPIYYICTLKATIKKQ